MTLIRRMGAALRALRGNESGAAVAVVKAMPYAFPEERQEPSWMMGGSGNAGYVADGFERNAVLYAAVMYKYRASMAAPLRAYRGDVDAPEVLMEEHPLARLIAQPNQHQAWHEFQGLCTVYLNVMGNAFIYLEREKRGGLPSAMYPLRPDRVRILYDRQKVRGYFYKPEGRDAAGFPILPGDMLHYKYPNPGDGYEGMGEGLSPIAAMAQSGDVDNQVTAFLKKFFERGMMPPGYLKFDIPLTEAQVAEARGRWMKIYGGVDNWHKPAVLDSGGEYKQASPTFDEMGFADIDERNESRILAAVGVPPILIGSRIGLKHATYANYETARRAFWEDVMQPEMLMAEAEYRRVLRTADGAWVSFDFSRVPALRVDIEQQARAAQALIQMGVPPEVAFQTVGLRVEGYVGGEEAQQPVKAKAASPADSLTPSPSPERRGVKEAKDLEGTGRRAVELADGHVADFEEGAESAFEQDRREILAIVSAAKDAALRRKASIDWAVMERDIIKYLGDAGAENWREVFVPLIEGVVNDVGEEWASALGIDFAVRNWRGEEWFDKYVLVFAQPINATTSDDIHQMLAAAQADGWTIAEMQDRLETLFQQYMKGDLSPEDFAWLDARMPPYRREMIARTETIRAAGAGAQALFTEWGVTKRQWLATSDNRTRDSHVQANGQVREIDKPFDVGGYKMMYPGDASLGAPPKEFVSCRCTVIAVVED